MKNKKLVISSLIVAFILIIAAGIFITQGIKIEKKDNYVASSNTTDDNTSKKNKVIPHPKEWGDNKDKLSLKDNRTAYKIQVSFDEKIKSFCL